MSWQAMPPPDSHPLWPRQHPWIKSSRISLQIKKRNVIDSDFRWIFLFSSFCETYNTEITRGSVTPHVLMCCFSLMWFVFGDLNFKYFFFTASNRKGEVSAECGTRNPPCAWACSAGVSQSGAALLCLHIPEGRGGQCVRKSVVALGCS